MNLSVTETQGPGDIRIWPAGNPFLNVSTQNWQAAGTTIANAAIVAAGTDGAVTVVIAGSDTHLVIDINGYYAPIPIVNTVNNLVGDLTLAPGPNVQINTFGNTLTIGASSGATGWSLVGNSGTTPGFNFIGTTDSAALEIKVNSQRALRLEPTSPPNVIGGFSGNYAAPGSRGVVISGGGNLSVPNFSTEDFGTIGGGSGNRAGNNNVLTGDATGATVGGGLENRANGYASTVSGGQLNWAGEWGSVGGGYSNSTGDPYGTVAGGRNNMAGGGSVVGGGHGNSANGGSNTIAGGESNTITGSGWSTIGGGNTNTVTEAFSATVPGGENNSAAGNYSFAAGRRAKANHAGAFVWGDGSNFDIASANANEFRVRATGGVAIVTAVDGIGAPLNGAILPTNGGAWSYFSSRNAKENFNPVDAEEILARVARLRLSTWNYRSQDPSIRHIGPVAQDFAASFGFGESEEYINSADADGVALAAIQALHQIVQERVSEVDALRAETVTRDQQIRALQDRLEKLERRLRTGGSAPAP